MKITKIKWNDHPVLGSLELDLTKSDGKPYDVILLAGENGVGKTSILEGLSTFLNRGSFKYFEYIEYEVNNHNYKAVQSANNQTLNFYDRIDLQTNNKTPIHSDKNNNPKSIETDMADIRHDGCVFSRARSDFRTKPIQSTTTKKLDVDKYDLDNEEDFTSLKQLIVDIVNQDNAEYADVNKSLGNNPKSWDEFEPTTRMFRFTKAFNSFFEKIKFDKVSDTGQEKSILFSKNGKSIPIDKLSTGEKQIVFRGTYLLRNSNKLGGSTIMVDEPELSMHPKWQERILKYYTDLFTENASLKVQLLLATHSELVLKEALKDQDRCLVFALTDDNGTITAKKIDAPTTLPTITSAETNYLAFDMVSNDYHIELYGYLQTKYSKDTVKKCDDYIKSTPNYTNDIAHLKKPSANPSGTNYETLPTYIRNAIDHPDPGKTFTDEELRMSIELLIHLCT